MDNFKRLLDECKALKARIQEIESREVLEIHKTIKQIQLQSLKEQLTKVGRQLHNLSLYKRDEND